MTGIAAIFSPAPDREDRLATMLASLGVRLHDTVGTFARGPLALGACVLETTGESVGTAQPLANEDSRLAVVLDGYLTNWEELRSDLLSRGAVLRDRSDAELVLRAYEQWGDDCVRRFDGEFAFVIADAHRRRLYGARDHAGLRPLFVYRDGDAWLFASEIGAIVAALGRRPEPNLAFLADLVAGDVFAAEETAWKGLCALPHAQWFACDANGLETRRHYELPTARTIRYRSDAEYAEHYRAVLFEAVRRASRSQAPLAVEVSGGLDSSAIFAVADHLAREGRLLAPGFAGYTLAGAPGTRADELDYARAVGAHLGRPVVEAPMFEPGRDWYEAEARREHHLPPPSNLAMSIELERLAAQDGARVLVSGQGGDEWLGGSLAYYREFAEDRDLGGFVGALRGDLVRQGLSRTMRTALRLGLSGLLPSSLRDRIAARERRGAGVLTPTWLRPQWRESVLQRAHAWRATLPGDPGVRLRQTRLVQPWSLYSRPIFHRQPATRGLELRYPMLSRAFIAFAAATPEHARLRNGVNKYTHRAAIRGLLPGGVVDRSTKAAFDAPAANAAFLRFCTREAVEDLSPLVDAGELVNALGLTGTYEVDPSLTWEIYGLHAAACFLRHVRLGGG